MNHAATTKVERGQFELKLPDLFQVKPAHEIDLPAKRKAMVFDTKVMANTYDDNGKQIVSNKDGWRVVVVTRTGKVINDRYCRDPNYGCTFTDPLLLGLYVQSIVTDLLKTKRTQVTETEPNEDE